ncbi:ABC transporter permease [Yinghuangia seranimata]|uniref:ABC transporter permease n=1 Tax=Yinghuangia seranimata TaxID=408067 RepID=UPI00248BC05F|nr:ABC transporter permease [Yinghuangia seranimata]MDI2132929.1 ABC transporter permease [Yinghuangia seranimata]
MLRTALRNVVAHKARLVMTLLAVLLGVSFVTGTLVFSDTIAEAYTHSASKSYRDVSVAVTDTNTAPYHRKDNYDGDPRLTEETLAGLRALPGAAAARGVVEGFTGVVDRDGDLIGSDWSTTGTNFVPDPTGKDPRYPMSAGAGPRGPGEIALDSGTARRGGFHVGDTVRIAGDGPVTAHRLTGVFATDDQRVAAGGSLVLFDTATAQKRFLRPGEYGAVHLRAAPGTSDDTLSAAVSAAVPDAGNIEVRSGRSLAQKQADVIRDATRQMATGLLAFAAIALFVGCFIIANTFTMLVAQRTREVALLRAVGAGRGQVVRSILYEAAAVGAVASALGLALGVLLAALMRELLLSNGALLPDGPLVTAPTTIAAGLAVGLGVTVTAAWLPARRAARIPPVAAINTVEQPSGHRSLRTRNTTGAVLAAAGTALVAYGSSTGGESGRAPVACGVLLLLVGVLVLTPLLTRPTVGALRRPLDRAFGVPGRLAGENALRNPRRTAATASALTIGLTLIAGLSVIGASVRQAVERDAIAGITADYKITMGNEHGLDPAVRDAAAAAPGVRTAAPLMRAPLHVDGHTMTAVGVPAADAGDVLELTPDSVAALRHGQVLVAKDAAAERGWRVGTQLTVEYPDGTSAQLTVGGIHGNPHVLTDITLPDTLLRPHARDAEVSALLVRTTDPSNKATTRALRHATGDNPLMHIDDRAAIQASFSRDVDLMLNIMYGLLGMAVLIAVLGVVNTLAMSVVERRREIGLLRAIGLDRTQVRRMIRIESLIIAMFGAALGVLLGIFLAWGILGTLRSVIPGLALVVPWGAVAVFLALGAAVGLVAALWPARSATRLDIVAAIAAE